MASIDGSFRERAIDRNGFRVRADGEPVLCQGVSDGSHGFTEPRSIEATLRLGASVRVIAPAALRNPTRTIQRCTFAAFAGDPLRLESAVFIIS